MQEEEGAADSMPAEGDRTSVPSQDGYAKEDIASWDFQPVSRVTEENDSHKERETQNEQKEQKEQKISRAHRTQNGDSLWMRFITQRRPDDVFLLDEENLTDEEKTTHS